MKNPPPISTTRGLSTKRNKYTTPQHVTCRRSERLSTLSHSGQKDLDLSQNLLDDDAPSAVGDGSGNITKELNFTLSPDVTPDDAANPVVTKKPRLSTVDEGITNSSPTSLATNSVQTNITPGGHGFPKAGDDDELRCAALELCTQPTRGLESIASTCICINCNFTAHLECADQLFVQRPKTDGPIDYCSHLSKSGKENNWRGNEWKSMSSVSC